jgi:hypothetical protein
MSGFSINLVIDGKLVQGTWLRRATAPTTYLDPMYSVVFMSGRYVFNDINIYVPPGQTLIYS